MNFLVLQSANLKVPESQRQVKLVFQEAFNKTIQTVRDQLWIISQAGNTVLKV
jgi:hypothetical protein